MAPDAQDRSHTHPPLPSPQADRSSASRPPENRASSPPPTSEATRHISSTHCCPSQTHRPLAAARRLVLSDSARRKETQSVLDRTATSSHGTSHPPAGPHPSEPSPHASRAPPPAYSPRRD